MAALRARLRRDVPRIARSNGTEETEESVLPHEASEEWRGATEGLYLGELDAILDGEPPTPLHEWQNARVSIENKLLSFADADEVTEGEPALSRRGHAKQALAMLDDIDRLKSWIRGQLDPAERPWLDQLIAEVAHLGFSSGSHTRSALGKAIEESALQGMNMRKYASQGGKAASAARNPLVMERLRRMQANVDQGHSISAAVQHTTNAGLGNKEANEKLWRRHKK